MKFNIGGIGLSIEASSSNLEQRIKSHYNKFRSSKEPDICITVRHVRGALNRPDFDYLLFKTDRWELGREKKDGKLSLYFPDYSIARFNENITSVDFYTKDSSGHLLLYLFPEILFSLILSKYNALMLHACGILDKGRGYLFIADSDGGKSTIAKLGLKNNMRLLNDDRIIVRKENGLFKMYGNPWYGTVKVTSNRTLCIRRIFFLKKSQYNYIEPMSDSESVIQLLKNSFYIPVDNDIIKKVFNLCYEIAVNLDCSELGFKADASVWRYLYGLPE